MKYSIEEIINSLHFFFFFTLTFIRSVKIERRHPNQHICSSQELHIILSHHNKIGLTDFLFELEIIVKTHC